LNFCVVLAKGEEFERFSNVFLSAQEAYKKIDTETKNQDAELTQTFELLSALYSAL
jgi:hypothetical protein